VVKICYALIAFYKSCKKKNKHDISNHLLPIFLTNTSLVQRNTA